MLPLRVSVNLGNGNEVVHCISGASPLDCVVSHQDTRWNGEGLTTLQRCSRCILKPQWTSLRERGRERERERERKDYSDKQEKMCGGGENGNESNEETKREVWFLCF